MAARGSFPAQPPAGPGTGPPTTQPTGPGPAPPAGPPPDDPGERLAGSARGWQRIQLAVLGFIGFCGVLWAGGDTTVPAGGQWLVAGLVVLSFALACLAIYLVGRVAYPLHPAPDLLAGARRLRAGIRITYLALAILVVATLSAWWPGSDDAGSVEVRDAAGRAWCGELVAAPAGEVRLDTAEGRIAIPVTAVATIQPATTC